MNKRFTFFIVVMVLLINSKTFAADEPIIVQAESGTLGSDYTILTETDISFVDITSVLVNADFPGNDNRVITYNVTFPDSGTYDLFARLRVGEANFDDDSYFYANGFGIKNSTDGNDWIKSNQLAVAGYTVLTDVVADGGSAGSNVWKWVNMSEFNGQETPITFHVNEGDLTQTFQIGGRENGLQFDKLAFGRSNLYYTVKNLNNIEPGSVELPVPDTTAKPLADGLSKFLGCSYGADSKEDFENYWNQVTPGNGGKWGSVEGTRDVMNWTELDAAYELARTNKFPFKLHVLVWGNQQPAWIESLDSAEQHQEIEEWYAAIAERYDTLDMVEVVNEPLHDPPNQSGNGGGNYYGALGGAGVTGWDWILESFRLARIYFPNSELILNDYSITNSLANTQEYIEIINLLMADTLVDAVGIQQHSFETNGVSSALIQSNLDLIAETGLPMYITELDIDGLTDAVQLPNYQRLFPIFWEHPAMKGVTLWGFRSSMWRGEFGAYLITDEGVERPAMLWLRAYLNGTYIENESISVSSVGGSTTISDDNGTLQLEASLLPIDATIQDVEWKVSPSGLATVSADGLVTAIKDGTITVTAKSIEYLSTVKGTIEIIINNQVSGINTIGNSKVVISPNPSTDGNFVISGLPENIVGQLDVLDMSGRTINSLPFNNTSQVNITISQPGLYIIKVINNNEAQNYKVIVN